MWAENLDRGVEPADPVSAGRDLRELGYYVMVVQELGRNVQVGVRYDDYKPDRDSSERIGADLVPRNDHDAQLAAVAAFRVSSWLRVVAEYDHNWNSLGRALDGKPTTLGSDLLTFRGQVTY